MPPRPKSVPLSRMTQAERLAKASDPTLTEAEARTMLTAMKKDIADQAPTEAEAVALALLRNPNLPAPVLIEIAAWPVFAAARRTGEPLIALGENPALPLLLLTGDFSYAKGEDKFLQTVFQDAHILLLGDNPYGYHGCRFPFPHARPSQSSEAYAQWQASLEVAQRAAFFFYARVGEKDHGAHSLYNQMRRTVERIVREDVKGGALDNRYESFGELVASVSSLTMHSIYAEPWWRQGAFSVVLSREVLLAQGRAANERALLPGFAPIAEALSPWKP